MRSNKNIWWDNIYKEPKVWNEMKKEKKKHKILLHIQHGKFPHSILFRSFDTHNKTNICSIPASICTNTRDVSYMWAYILRKIFSRIFQRKITKFLPILWKHLLLLYEHKKLITSKTIISKFKSNSANCILLYIEQIYVLMVQVVSLNAKINNRKTFQMNVNAKYELEYCIHWILVEIWCLSSRAMQFEAFVHLVNIIDYIRMQDVINKLAKQCCWLILIYCYVYIPQADWNFFVYDLMQINNLFLILYHYFSMHNANSVNICTNNLTACALCNQQLKF